MDLSRLGRTEQVLSAAGLLLFIFGFLPWFSVSGGGQSVSYNAWENPSGFNDWFPILLLFFYGIILALPAFGVAVSIPVLARPANRAFIGLVLSALAVLLFAIQGLTYPSVPAEYAGLGISAGPAWAYFISLILALGAGVQSYLGFTQQGGSFAQISAAFQARTQAVQQQQQAPYGQAPGAPYGQAPGAPYAQGAPQQPYQNPQQPYGQGQQPAHQPYDQPQQPYGQPQQPPQPPYGS